MKRLRAVVHGFVQRVGYRQFALRRARSLGLCGWVMNHENGTVEVVAEGERAKLEYYLRQLRRGPTYARVQHLEHEWQDPGQGLQGFEIRFAD
jgi:acylphosphatase